MVMLGDKICFIDKSGDFVVQCRSGELGWFFEGLSVARDADKYGYINKSGTDVIGPPV